MSDAQYKELVLTTLAVFWCAVQFAVLREEDLKAVTALKAEENFREIQPHAESRQKQEQRLMEKYEGSPGDDGIDFKDKQGDEELEALNEETVSVKIKPISVDELDDIRVKGRVLGVLKEYGFLEA